MKYPGCCGIGECGCLCTPSSEATGQSRWRKEGEGPGFNGMPGREAAQLPLSAEGEEADSYGETAPGLPPEILA